MGVPISFAFPDKKIDFEKEKDFEELGHGAGWGATIEEWTCWELKQDYCTKSLVDMNHYWEDRWSWCTDSFKDQRVKEIDICPEDLWRDIWDHSGTTLEPLWDHSGTTLGPRWERTSRVSPEFCISLN